MPDTGVDVDERENARSTLNPQKIKDYAETVNRVLNRAVTNQREEYLNNPGTVISKAWSMLELYARQVTKDENNPICRLINDLHNPRMFTHEDAYYPVSQPGLNEAHDQLLKYLGFTGKKYNSEDAQYPVWFADLRRDCA